MIIGGRHLRTSTKALVEIRHLRAFLAVADTHSIRRAATKLHVGQPALSRTIRDLEHELGITLFMRSAKGVKLTRGGQRFLSGARRTLSEATAAIARAKDARDSTEGPLVVGVVNPELRPAWIRTALERYRKAAPNVAVHLESMASIAMSEATLARAIDVGLGYAMLPASAGVTVETVTEDEMAGVIIARGHKLARRRRISVFELEPYEFMWYDRAVHPTMFDRIFGAFHRVGFTPHLVPAIGQVDANSATAFALVSSGYGWALLPTTARLALPATLRYVALTDIAIPLETQLIARTDDRSTRSRVFRRIVQDLAGTS
jgi:DNA-binding transcriptional LysR family regulator